ncbi:hypothetical protein B0O99DRAFT_688282 [Bisporella sp. PMI_857]|nr:hypothetical protein B0O99DRAFT_688282 [Bisporella sp. PMI_857]
MPPSRANTLRTLFVVFLALSHAFVYIRVYARTIKTTLFDPSDCFLLAAVASFSIYVFSGMMSIQHGIGTSFIPTPASPYPAAFASPHELATALRFWLLSEVHYILTATLLRLSALLQLRTLATLPKQRLVLLILTVGMVLYDTGFFLLLIFQCAPVQYFWKGWFGRDSEFEMASGVSGEWVAQVSYGFAGVGTGTDWLLAVLAPWFFWEKEKDMTPTGKWGLRACLITGICAGSACLVRIPTTNRLLTTDDFFYDCVPIAIGSVLESGLGIVALSATAFKPLCPSLFEKPPKPAPAEPPIPLELPAKRLSRSSESSNGASADALKLKRGKLSLLVWLVDLTVAFGGIVVATRSWSLYGDMGGAAQTLGIRKQDKIVGKSQ